MVCRSCERWNLTPLEERWEAVETCEEIFRGTQLRTSTENIGLARHPEGLDLVRIGKPLRPEFAAWRYGDQFGRRRNRMIVYGSVAGLATAGGIVAGGVFIGLAGGAIALDVANIVVQLSFHRARIRIRGSDGRITSMRRKHVWSATRIEATDDEVGFRMQTANGVWVDGHRGWIEGEDARRALATILPSFNIMGAGGKAVREAVSRIELRGGPRQFLHETASRKGRYSRNGLGGYVNKMPKPVKLGLEMVLHEEQERRALEGELWQLEQAWRDAEEIAAIADDLLLPKGTAEFVARHRDGRG